jgi:hypothetical protein
LYRWLQADSVFLGVAGFLPVSDAMGYFRCALSAAYPPPFDLTGVSADWCGRRILYPLSLISVLALGGFSSGIALLLQALIVGAAIVAVAIAARRAFATTVGVVTGVLCALFAYLWATANFMTEFLGLSAGLVSASLLLTHARTRNLSDAAAGVTMLSLAMTARAGALFAVPLVCVWAYLMTRPANVRSHGISLLVLALAALIGPALHVLGAWQIGANLSNIGGNFSASLYGLSTGTRDWSEAYRTFSSLLQSVPEGEAFQIIQSKALQNISAHPTVFLKSLYQAGLTFVRGLFGFTSLPVLNPPLTVLLVIGVLQCCRQWRVPAMSLVLLVFVGELVSAPFVIDSGGHRVLAATVWCRAILAGIGLWTCVVITIRLFGSAKRGLGSFDAKNGNRIGSWALSAMLVGLVVAPLTPLIRLMQPIMLELQHSCPSGQFATVANIEAESMAVGVATRNSVPLFGPLLVARGRLEADSELRAAWWGQRIGAMPPDSWIVLAFDRQAKSRGQLHSLFFQGSLPPSNSGLYAICAGELERDRQLGDFELRRVVTITPLARP